MQCVVSLLFASICYFIFTRRSILILFYVCFLILYFCFLFCVFCVFVLFCVFFPVVYICLFPNFVQVHRPLPPDGNPTAVTIPYRIVYHIILYITSYHTIPYFIVSYIIYHIVSSYRIIHLIILYIISYHNLS